jgi:L,D-peptidoglycan transpeptidase YkuD (ErfK/YbiS/YcfS/YnhG family)
MQSIKQTVTIAGVLTTVFIPPVKAEERVIRTRTYSAAASTGIVGRGSVVFLHLARANFGLTTGWVSMTRSAMLQLLRKLGRRTILLG